MQIALMHQKNKINKIFKVNQIIIFKKKLKLRKMKQKNKKYNKIK